MQPKGPRRTSFSFLRRGKSVERLNSKRSISGSKLQKKSIKLDTAEHASVPERAPKIPDLVPQPRLSNFGGEDATMNRTSMPRQTLGQQQAPLFGSSSYGRRTGHELGAKKAAEMDTYDRAESMTHRGRYSYASSVVSTLNAPRRVRRRKDPIPFK